MKPLQVEVNRDMPSKLEEIVQTPAVPLEYDPEKIIDSERYKVCYNENGEIEYLGEGFWGVVYKFHDVFLQEECAIKIPKDTEWTRTIINKRNLNLIDELREEAGPRKNRNIPNIVPTDFEFDKQGRPFLPMPVYQPFLEQVLEKAKERKDKTKIKKTEKYRKLKPLPSGLYLDEVIHIINQVGAGLSGFQKNYGRAYCDLKESNVAADVHDPDFDYDNWNLDDIDLTKWSFHVADKGTATVISTDNHTGPRDNMGHEETRSPENFLKGNNPDSRFDVFALGMFTYKLIHGEYFLKGEDPALFYKQKKDKEVKRKIKKNIARKLRKPLEKSLKINPDDRYTSVDDFVKDLNKRVVSEITEPRPILTTGILFGALGFFIIAAGGLGVYLRNKNVTLPELVTAVEEGKKYVEEGKKYKVEAKWDGETLEISNNLITLDIKANDYKEKKSFDSDELWHLNPGSKLNATMFVRDVARPRAREEIKGEVTPSLRGKVYIQGYSGEDFWISPGPHDQSFVNDMGTTIGYKYFDIKVPKDIPKGNHFLALEIYAPKEDEDDGYGEIHEKFIFSNPGKAIARKLIPILIGELEEKNRVNIGAMNLNWLNPYISMRSQEPRKVWYMTNDINTNLIYEVSIPEINYKKEFNREGDNTINSYWIRAGIPDAPSPGPRILQVVTKNKQEEPISYGWIPINWELTYTNSDGKENYEWALDIPGPDFCERLIDYRKNLMQKEGTK